MSKRQTSKPAPENQPNRAPYAIAVGGAASAAFVGCAIAAGWVFPLSIEHSVALEMFRGILQVDGFLIGFVGVLASLAITEFRELLEGFQRNPMTPKEAREDPQLAWLWWIGFERLQDRRWTIVWITGGIVVLLVMSILSALVAMSRLTHIWDCADSGTFILPICAMIAGIDGIFLILVLVAMRGQPSSDGKKSRTSEQ